MRVEDHMRKLVKQLRHGQITIPKEFRDALGIEETDMLSISLEKGKLEVEPVRMEPKAKGSPWAKELYELYAPVRASLEGTPEPEINEAIDEALKEVRARKN
jgi:AbrB family looped-hinge helix DNA binding protein